MTDSAAPAPEVDTAMLRADISEWAKTEAEPLIRVARRLCDALDAARSETAAVREELAAERRARELLAGRTASYVQRAEAAEAEAERLRDVQLRQRERAEAAEAELAAAKTQIREYERIITWDVTCSRCATLLDSSYAQTCRAETAEADLAAARAEAAAARHLLDKARDETETRAQTAAEAAIGRVEEVCDQLENIAQSAEVMDVPAIAGTYAGWVRAALSPPVPTAAPACSACRRGRECPDHPAAGSPAPPAAAGLCRCGHNWLVHNNGPAPTCNSGGCHNQCGDWPVAAGRGTAFAADDHPFSEYGDTGTCGWIIRGAMSARGPERCRLLPDATIHGGQQTRPGRGTADQPAAGEICPECRAESPPYVGPGVPVPLPGTLHNPECPTVPRLSPAEHILLTADLVAIAASRRRAWAEGANHVVGAAVGTAAHAAPACGSEAHHFWRLCGCPVAAGGTADPADPGPPSWPGCVHSMVKPECASCLYGHWVRTTTAVAGTAHGELAPATDEPLDVRLRRAARFLGNALDHASDGDEPTVEIGVEMLAHIAGLLTTAAGDADTWDDTDRAMFVDAIRAANPKHEAETAAAGSAAPTTTQDSE